MDRKHYRKTAVEVSEAKPYRSSVKEVWKSGASPKDTLESVENKLSNIEKKLQSMESFVTSDQYELEKKFRDIEA